MGRWDVNTHLNNNLKCGSLLLKSHSAEATKAQQALLSNENQYISVLVRNGWIFLSEFAHCMSIQNSCPDAPWKQTFQHPLAKGCLFCLNIWVMIGIFLTT